MITTTLHEPTTFLWLEITNRCQLECVHCLNESGPRAGHGAMTIEGWRDVVDQAAAVGVRMVQFIGGEPTTHPGLVTLVEHALTVGLEVEVFSNLYRVTPAVWSVLERPGVRLATSYYSDDAAQHDAITTRVGSHARTRLNIAEAVRLGIEIRVGIIDVTGGQRVEQARTDLLALGVPDEAIGYDEVRPFGRATKVPTGADEAESCGQCGHGTAAVLPGGTVAPCVFTRSRQAGSVLEAPLGEIIGGMSFRDHVEQLDAVRTWLPATTTDACRPYTCSPAAGCKPACFPSCSPAGTCKPFK